jgi:hypothetical protein
MIFPNLPGCISRYIYEIAAIVVISILCLLVFIFFPRYAGYYDIKLFPQLKIFEETGIKDDVLDEAKKDMTKIKNFFSWVTNPEILCAPLIYIDRPAKLEWEDGKSEQQNIEVHISSSVTTPIYKVLSQIDGLCYAYVLKLNKQTDLTRENTECDILANECITCHIPLTIQKRKKVGVSVSENEKYYTNIPILFDSSRPHAFLNRSYQDVFVLCLGITRPPQINAKLSEVKLDAKKIIQFFDQ